ncbi:RNA polymerase sigma factor [Methylocystis sp. JR02]|uniref:RNA polymerase sigma factor n=2 Tax=unclassified Methylocystis TaxID=2625913 RepID=UPI0024BBAD71|nr:RNA polymerase sigma factor [Methylocystis sp. JR02]MDJ0449940.1 RNA polymerase sigma factor [Methylocystis sp. JR02]
MRLSNAAIETLYRDEHKSLCRVTRRKMNHQDSEDVAQEAFLRLLEMERRETIADPRSYLFRIGLNIAIDWLRKARTRAAFLVEADGVDECSTINMTSDTPFDDWLTFNAVLTELSRLSGRCRDIFLLSRVYELDNAEIAAKLGISVRTVNRDIGLATKHLCSVLDGPATQKKNSNLTPILQQKFVFVVEAIGNWDRNIERRNRCGALRYARSQRRNDQAWITSNCLDQRERAADAL